MHTGGGYSTVQGVLPVDVTWKDFRRDTTSFDDLEKQSVSSMEPEGLKLDLKGGILEGSMLDGDAHGGRPLVISNGIIVVDVIRNLVCTVFRNMQIIAPDRGEVVVIDCDMAFEGCSIRGSPMVICGRSTVEMNDCQVEHSARHGIVLHSGEGCVLKVENCSFSKNQQSGMYVSAMFQGEKRSLYNLPYHSDSEFQPAHLTAMNCHFQDNEEFGSVIMGSAVASFSDCTFQRSLQRSGLWCGASTHVSLTDCQIWDNFENGVYMHGGGSVAFVKGCCFNGSKEYHGLIVEGKGTKVSVNDCEFVGNQKSGVVVTGGACVTLEDCVSSGSKKNCGLSVRGTSSRARAHKCKFLGNNKCNSMVHKRGAAIFESCTFEAAKLFDGLQVADSGTRVTATDCTFSGNQNDGACVLGGATAEFAKCMFRESATCHGLEVMGKGTDVSVGNSMFDENYQSGVLVHGQAFLIMDGCTSKSSVTMHGVEVCEEGTHASMAHCHFMKNHENGILVQSGAMAHMNACKAMHSSTMHGMEIRGIGTKASITNCNFERTRWCGAYVHQGGALIGGESVFLGGRPGMGLCVGGRDYHLQIEKCVLNGKEVSEYSTDAGNGFRCFNRRPSPGIYHSQ